MYEISTEEEQDINAGPKIQFCSSIAVYVQQSCVCVERRRTKRIIGAIGIVFVVILIGIILQKLPIGFTKNTHAQKTFNRPNATLPPVLLSHYSGLKITDAVKANILNKQCYAALHGYEFILHTENLVHEIYKNNKELYWLKHPHWNKIPALKSLLEEGYPYVLLSDVDFWVKDISVPLKTHMIESSLLGTDASIFLPRDSMESNSFAFSNFAMIIKNTNFSKTFVQKWEDIMLGKICPKGSVFKDRRSDPNRSKITDNWADSDQPGMWIALVLTAEIFTGHKSSFKCDENGYFTPNAYHINDYFKKLGYRVGNSAYDLKPNVKQHIIWSTTSEYHSRPGLGLQMNWGNWGKLKEFAFGVHEKHVKHLPEVITKELDVCKKNLGCVVEIHNDTGKVFKQCTLLSGNL